jgi:Zinc finger, C2H2 type
LPVTFVDSTYSPTKASYDATTIKALKPPELEKVRTIPDAMRDHQYTTEPTFDGNYSSDDYEDVSNDELLGDSKKTDRKDAKVKKHKLRQLTGKPACKYCDTVFISRESLKMHICKYLSCDSKNFICRICHKELSKKTFSNHLHETLDCQYCGKKFVNPRNMKIHIKNIHANDTFVPPNSPKREMFAMFENQDEKALPVLDETTGILVAPAPKKRKKYPRKKGRFECGKIELLSQCQQAF